MKKAIVNYGGLIFFYIVIIVGLLLLNLRFEELNGYVNACEVTMNYVN